jgi:lauroyl/myristoyl acyltransferase
MLWLIDWFACRLVKSLTACLCLVPVEWGLWCGRRVGDAIYAYKRTRVVVAEVNLRWAFGSRYTRHARLQLVRETCHTLGQTAVELLRLACMDVSYVDRYVTVRGMAHLDAAMQPGELGALIHHGCDQRVSHGGVGARAKIAAFLSTARILS